MSFASIRFLIFFPCVFLLYYALPHRARKFLLLAASYYFYMCWKPEFIVLIVVSTCIDYFCGLGIERHRDDRRAAKALLTVSMCMNLGLLFFFKYFNFFGETLTALCKAISIPFSVPTLNIILPVGISFYTFQTMSYTIDVYRGKLEAEHDFVTFALFVSFFPQLVAGPIEKAANLLPQLKVEHPFSYDNAAYGARLMAWGFFKKLVVADSLAAWVVDPVYQNLSIYPGGALIIATAAFAFQIYCDFSGYSDIARGCARMMGIELMVNFKQPYAALSLTDFWRRWHISLTDWFRDYVYMPLVISRPIHQLYKRSAAKYGRSRANKLSILIPNGVVWLLTGLWHGAAWTFVLWGLWHGIFCALEGMGVIRTKRLEKCFGGRLLLHLYTLAVVLFGVILFRANTMADALYVILHCLDGIGAPLAYLRTAYHALGTGEIKAAAMVFSLCLLFAFDIANEKRDAIKRISAWPVYIRWPAYIGFVLMVLMLMQKNGTAPFIYFQF